MDNLFDEPSKQPARRGPSRFAPKGAKPVVQPKPEPSSNSLPPTDVKIETKPEPVVDEMVIDNVVKKEETGDFMETEENGLELPVVEDEVEVEDDVVREIDVYFNPSVDSNSKLYVLQYPLRPLWRPYELDDRCEAVRVLGDGEELEIDLGVDVDSRNYNSRDETKQMEKQTLLTRWKPAHTRGYTAAVGVLVDNKLHLNPVHAVVQLRPSMQHLVSEESKKVIPPVSVEKKVKFEKPPEVPSTQMEWVPLRYLGMKSDMASRYMQKMAEAGGSSIHFSMSSYDYLDRLCPGTSNGSLKSKGPPRRELLRLPLEERLKTWLREGPPLQRFDALKHLAKEESDEQFLDILQEHALLVQGLWVPKTTLLYGTECQGHQVFARDFVLTLFSKDKFLHDSLINKLPQKMRPAVRVVLKELAVERQSFDNWKLKELPDDSFIKRFPSIVTIQKEKWQILEKQFKIGDKSNGPGTNAPSSNSPPVIDPSTLKESTKGSKKVSKLEPSKNAMTEEAREATTKAVQKLLKNFKVCSYQQIPQRIRDMAVSESQNARPTAFARVALTAAESVSAHPDELPAIIDELAFNIHGVCVPKSSPDHPEYDQLRSVVIDLFRAEKPNAKLKKATITEAAKLKLGKDDIPQAEFQKVLREICVSQGTFWVLQSGDGNPKH